MKRNSIFLFALFIFIASCSVLKKKEKYIEPTTGRIVQIQTDFGNMTIALSDSTPLHRDNFIKLVKQKFYDSLLFHRVINSFMIQGGDPTSKNAKEGTMIGNGGPGYTIPAEFKPYLFHRKGALAAARDNNPQKASSGCQFYIVQGKSFSEQELRMGFQHKNYPDSIINAYVQQGGTPHLDLSYTVFGYLTEGYNVLDKIAAVATKPGDRPVQDVRMKVVIIR